MRNTQKGDIICIIHIKGFLKNFLVVKRLAQRELPMSDKRRHFLRKAKFLQDRQLNKLLLQRRMKNAQFTAESELLLHSLNELKYDQFCLVVEGNKKVVVYIDCKKCKKSKPWNVIHSILHEERLLMPNETKYLKIIKDHWDALVPKIPMAMWTAIIDKCYSHVI